MCSSLLPGSINHLNPCQYLGNNVCSIWKEKKMSFRRILIKLPRVYKRFVIIDYTIYYILENKKSDIIFLISRKSTLSTLSLPIFQVKQIYIYLKKIFLHGLNNFNLTFTYPQLVFLIYIHTCACPLCPH